MKRIANSIKKLRKAKFLKTNPLKTCSNFISERGIGFIALENGRISKTDKNFRKLQKIPDFIQKMQKFETLRCFKKTISLLLETMQSPINKPQTRLPGP